jgi:Domain of unknown function (DUF5666)
MSAIPHDNPDQALDSLGQRPQTTGPDALVSPGGRRRRFFNRKTAALGVVVACAAGFLAGIEIEKSQVSGTASAATVPAGNAGSAATGSGARPGFGLGGGGAGGGGGASFGTVSSVDGNTIYLTEASGNTVKVTLSSATKITKSQSTSKSSLHPGDALVVQGATGKNGTLTATSVSDSGARASLPGGGAGSGGSTTTSNSTGAAGTGTTG